MISPPSSNLPEWYCVRSQTKREHIAAGYLRELEGVEVFCPRLRYRKATRRGKIWWMEPLFPGYLLARFCLADMERAVTFCQGVRGLVRFGTKIPPVPDSFVEALRQEVRARSDSDQETFSVSPVIEIGDEVEIAHGPLQGMRGTIISVAPAAERVKIMLEFLGQEHPVDVDLFSLLLPRRPSP
jgi:transcriptional antiterminator RfaH